MKPTTLTWCAAIIAGCAAVPSPTAAETARLDQAQKLLASDPGAALDIAEDLLQQNPDLRAARLLAGESSLRLAQQDHEGRTELRLQDAARHFEHGLDGVEDPAALAQLAECHYQLGDFEACSAAALRSATAYRARNTAAANHAAAQSLLLAARADLQRFVAVRKDEIATGEKDRRGRVVPTKATLELATLAATRFDAVRRDFPGETVTRIAEIQQWLGNGAGALQELERGVRETPDATEIHDAYMRWYLANDQHTALVGAYAQLVREQPGVPILRWHQGRALSAHADRLRQVGNFQAAADAYAKARDAFGEYLGMVPAHADATRHWLALCELALAGTVLEQGDVDGAVEHLFAAADASPRTLAYDDGQPQVVDQSGGHFTSIAFAIHRRLADGGGDALARTLRFDDRLLQRCPDRWSWAYNNAALTARDLGVLRQKQGDTAAAQELWERSYGYYHKAVELAPDDARTANDCGLMLVYHLHRDLGVARELFTRAIERGTSDLEALPADAADDERHAREEVVGDAWQNIAVLVQEQQGADSTEWRQFCERAVRYYPYGRREAAAMLRTAPADGHSAATPADAAQGGAAEALAKVKAEVEAKAAAEDYDGALALLDGIAKECKDHGPFQLLRGELNLKLARQRRDNRGSGVDFVYQDALTALQRAVELDGEAIAPRQLLAEAKLEAGDPAAAAKIAGELLLHLQSLGGGTPEQQVAAHRVRAEAAARAYAAGKAEQRNDNELLTEARASLRVLEKQNLLSPELRQLWSVTELWAGAPAEAVNVFLRALQQNPDDQTVLGAAVDTAAAQKQLPLAIDALSSRTDATGLWYLGRARYLFADTERSAGRQDQAMQLLDQAQQAFAASLQQNEAYRDSCEQWLAMCLGKKGTIAFYGNDDKNAEAWLLEAARLRPDRIGEDLGGMESTKRSLLLLVDRFMKKQDLARVEAISRAAADAANGDVDLLNNAGLFARDHGNQLERAGKKKAADEMYEQSYKAYRRALQLDPQSVQLRNDCALIAIYHLDRDWDESRAMLDSAIADGEARLRDDPPSDADERERLDMAVGDAYENLALWHLKHDRDGRAARAAAEASMRHPPGDQRPGARRHLQAAEQLLRGK